MRAKHPARNRSKHFEPDFTPKSGSIFNVLPMVSEMQVAGHQPPRLPGHANAGHMID